MPKYIRALGEWYLQGLLCSRYFLSFGLNTHVHKPLESNGIRVPEIDALFQNRESLPEYTVPCDRQLVRVTAVPYIPLRHYTQVGSSQIWFWSLSLVVRHFYLPSGAHGVGINIPTHNKTLICNLAHTATRVVNTGSIHKQKGDYSGAMFSLNTSEITTDLAYSEALSQFILSMITMPWEIRYSLPVYLLMTWLIQRKLIPNPFLLKSCSWSCGHGIKS